MYYEQHVCLKNTRAKAIRATLDGAVCYKAQVVTPYASYTFDIAFVNKEDALWYANEERKGWCNVFDDNWTEPKQDIGADYPPSDAEW